MSLSHLVAEALRQPSPLALERFLEEKCGLDVALREEVLRQVAAARHASTAEAHGPAEPPAATQDHEPASTGGRFTLNEADDGVVVGELLAEKYRLRERLGSGGMGTVFVADQVTPVQRRVAIKLIKAGMDSAQVLGRFAQERQALALMDHPNIARIYDGGLTRGGRPFFVMELVRGQPLTDYCDRERLGIRERIDLFIPICQAVQHAHQKGIIHRDLKPSNILVTSADGGPVPKIIDFGVAKAIHPGSSPEAVYTELNMIVGTPEYMAPEQAGFHGLDIDTRADIYSLGVVAYELLCGCLPFNRKELRQAGVEAMLRVIREVEPAAPSTRVAALPDAEKVAQRRRIDPVSLRGTLHGDLDWVVMKALAKERERRYATAQGLAADLERYRRQEPVLAAPPSARYRWGKFLARHRGKVLAGAAGLLLLVAAATVSTVGWVRAVRAERLAQEEAAVHQALVAFIQDDLFEAADPSERARLGLPLDAEVRLRTLIDRAAQRLSQGRFQEQPLVEAALRLTLARAYLSLGLGTPALSHAERADELRKAVLGPTHPSRLESLTLVGRVHYSSSEPEKARPCFAEALAARRATGSDEQPGVLELRAFLAGLDRQAGRLAEAEAAYDVLLQDQRRLLGPHHDDTLRTALALADVLLQQKRLGEAETLAKESLSAARDGLGPRHPTTLTALNFLARVYRAHRQEKEAEALYRELTRSSVEVYGADHPIVAVYKNNLAVCLIGQGRHAESLPLLREVEPVLERIGATHRITLVMQSNLASVLGRLGQRREALAKYELLLPRFLERFGEQHAATWTLLERMTTVYAEDRQLAKAEALLRRLLAMQRASQPPSYKNMVQTAGHLTQVLVDMNQAAAATTLLRELVAEVPAGPDRDVLNDLLAQLNGKR